MTQPVAERAVQVRPVVEGVHLVDPDTAEPVGVGLDGVEQRHRLAVGQRHDEIGAGPEVVEHGLGARDGSHPRQT